MPTTARPVQLEQQVMNALRFGGLDKENLRELVTIVAGLQDTGLRPVKVFPVGIPAPDGVEVHSILRGTDLKALLEVLRNPRIDRIRVFPKGIPVPDTFLTEIRIR